MIDFLNAGCGENLKHFPSGVVSVPLNIKDKIYGPPVEDVGELIAGTFGFTVEEGERAPVVEAKQGWALLLPVGSPVIARMRKNTVESLYSISLNQLERTRYLLGYFLFIIADMQGILSIK